MWQEILKHVKNQKFTLQELEYGKKTEKYGKWDKKHCLTWNMARNTENVENEKCTLYDLEYGEKTGNHVK